MPKPVANYQSVRTQVLNVVAARAGISRDLVEHAIAGGLDNLRTNFGILQSAFSGMRNELNFITNKYLNGTPVPPGDFKNAKTASALIKLTADAAAIPAAAQV